MARKQVLTPLGTLTANAGVATVLSGSSIKTTSIEIQALDTNSDIVYIGNSTSQLRAIAPGTSWQIWGDQMDHGVQGYVDLSEIYFRTLVNGEGIVVNYLAGY